MLARAHRPYAYADLLATWEAVPQCLHDHRKKQPWSDNAAPMQELQYPNMYIESSVDGAYGDKLTKRSGFLTTSKTKPLIIDSLAALLRQIGC